MKRTLKGILACLLAFMLVLPALTGALAEIARELPVSEDVAVVRSGAYEANRANGTSRSYGTSAIRRGRTFAAADVQASEGIKPTDRVTIMVELSAAPAADVASNLKNAGGYRAQLAASHKQAAAEIESKLGVEVEMLHSYTVLFNGFAFEGEYRLVEEIEKLNGMHAFVSPEWESPTLYNSVDMVGALEAWELGYTGKGYTIAILDTGCRVNHPAFSTMPDESAVQFTQDDIAALIAEGGFQGNEHGMDVNEVYVNAKIPFQWNYYYNHADAAHPGTSDHGTHVAGIAAGNNDVIQGVAPDAQLAIMQVFAPTGGASWSNILPALEDCAVLGVAAANLSLGSACGREAFYDPSYEQTLERCVEAGVNLSMSAGNDHDSSRSNRWGGNFGVVANASLSSTGYALASTPDFGVVGSPSTWPHGISVAAVENSMSRTYYIEADGNQYPYSENAANPVKMADALGGGTYEYVMVPGFGAEEDFAQVDVDGKIAVVVRGGINFVLKAANAEAAGAVACIIYNNTAGTLSMVAYEGGGIPHIAISQQEGLELAELENKQMYVSDEEGLLAVSSGNMTTAFSSRGVTANMAMKPEITAPGGTIYSSTDPNISDGNWYEAWNGTSMSAPHVAGGMAIISEYVDNMFPNASTAEKQELVDIILMSTATPVYDPSGAYAPVHQQGSGEMNLRKATTTKAYITVEGTKGERPKLNLGDDPEKTGEYSATFTVHNFGDETLNYSIAPSVVLNDLAIIGSLDGEPIIVYSGRTMGFENGMPAMLLGDVDMDGIVSAYDALLITRCSMDMEWVNNPDACDLNGDGEIGVDDALLAMRIALGIELPAYSEPTEGDVNFDLPASISVPAGETVEVTVYFTLSDEVMVYLDTYYTAGAMIEGFFELVPTFGENSLTVPFIKYYGDWNYPATIDVGYYYEDNPWNSNNFPNTAGYQTVDGVVYGLGINPYVETEDLAYYLEDRNAISPNGDYFLDTLNLVYAGLLRNSAVRYVVCDTEGNELHEIFSSGVCTKGYRTRGGDRDQLGVTYMNFPANFDFTQFGEEEVVVRVIADLDNDGSYTTEAYTPEANENPCWNIPIHVDTSAPTISNVYVSGNGVTFDATDDHYVAAVMVLDEDGEILSAQGVFETERGAVTNVTVQLDVGQYVVVADYAGNEQWFEFIGTPLVPIEPPALGPELIYSMGFNTEDNLAGWQVVDKDGDGANWGMRSTGNIYEGDRCMSSTSYQRTPDNWLLAPSIVLPEGEPYLTFFARGNYSTAYDEHFAVYIAPTGTPSVDDYIEIMPETACINAYQQYTVDLSEYAGQDVRIALRHFNSYNQNYITMDLWQIWN